MFCLMTFAIIDAGLLWWLKTGLRVTAALTARRGAIGYTDNTSGFPRTSTATTQSYAVTASQSWTPPNAVTASNVTVNGVVASRNGLSGTFFSVTITSSYFQFPPPPLGNLASLPTNACYPAQA